MSTTKIPAWKGIAVILSLVLGFVCWAISEYRPTAAGQIAWEIASACFFGVFVGAIIYAFVRWGRRGA